MEMTIDDKILVALYTVAIANVAPGGYRISELMPDGCTLHDARTSATRLLSEGYIEIPQGMTAGPVVYITEKGSKRAQYLLNLL